MSSQEQLSCNLCDFQAKTLRGLSNHKKRTHGETRIFVCELCSTAFNKHSNYHRHVASCMKNGGKRPSNNTEPNTINTNNINTSTTNTSNTSNTSTNANNSGQVMNGDVININIMCQKESDFEHLIPITSEAIRKATHTIFKNKPVKTVSDMACSLFDTCFKKSLITTDASRGTVVWKDGDDGNKKIKDPKAKILADKTIEAGRDVACKQSRALCEKFRSLDPTSIDYQYDQDSINDRNRLVIQHMRGDKSYRCNLASALSKLPGTANTYTVAGPTKLIDNKQSILTDFTELLGEWTQQNTPFIFYSSPNVVGARIKEVFALEVNEDKKVIYVVDNSKNLCPLTARQFGRVFYWCAYNTLNLFQFDEILNLLLTKPENNLTFVENERNIMLWLANKDPTDYFVTELFSGFFLE